MKPLYWLFIILQHTVSTVQLIILLVAWFTFILYFGDWTQLLPSLWWSVGFRLPTLVEASGPSRNKMCAGDAQGTSPDDPTSLLLLSSIPHVPISLHLPILDLSYQRPPLHLPPHSSSFSPIPVHLSSPLRQPCAWWSSPLVIWRSHVDAAADWPHVDN